MQLKDCHNFSDFRKLAKKSYHLLFFIILMEQRMMKLHIKEIQVHLTMLI